MTIRNRRELLFLYDVKNANPNGDPADENKPRMDEETGLNIVTDVRLKRTIRDYLFTSLGHNPENGRDIFVRTTESSKGGIKDGKARSLDFGKKKDEMLSNILSKCIDIRLFGGVLPLDKDSIIFTGPVQFKMANSLHRVELQYMKGTGAFASKDGANQQTFREEYILPYSLIAFYGIVNENAAKLTGLTDSDVQELKLGMWDGTKNLISRSKFEHSPKLLVEIKYKEQNFFIGELDKYISFDTDLPGEKIRDIEDGRINLSKLGEVIKIHSDKIESVEVKKNHRAIITGFDGIDYKEV